MPTYKEHVNTQGQNLQLIGAKKYLTDPATFLNPENTISISTAEFAFLVSSVLNESLFLKTNALTFVKLKVMNITKYLQFYSQNPH